MGNARILSAAVCAIVCLTAGAAAAKSLALIVGNDAYAEIEPLQKARSDAEGYAEFLGARGFDVTVHTDLDTRGMIFALATFYDRIEPGDQVVFAFSGHGWSDGLQNYLVPTDARAQGSETLLSKESFPLRNGVTGIIDEIAARRPALTVAIIDACRNNPFLSEAGTRSVGLARGLVRVSAPRGTFIAFSAGEGQTALDRLSDADASPYSVFTRHFLAELAKPQDLQSAFKATQAAVNDVALRIGHPQRPAYYDEVVGSACLTGACAVEPARAEPLPAPDAGALAAQEWQDFKESNSVAALTLFAERHDGTPYAALARERIAALQAAAASEPEPEPKVEPEPEPEPKVEPDPEPDIASRPASRDFARPAWCPKAASRTEKAICGDARLSALDIELERVYFAGLRAVSGASRDRLRQSQRDWLAERNNCGAGAGCLARAYEARLRVLGN